MSIKRQSVLVGLLGTLLMSACLFRSRAPRSEAPNLEVPYSDARDFLTDAGNAYTTVADTVQSVLSKPPVSEQEKVDHLMGSWVVFSLRETAKKIVPELLLRTLSTLRFEFCEHSLDFERVGRQGVHYRPRIVANDRLYRFGFDRVQHSCCN